MSDLNRREMLSFVGAAAGAGLLFTWTNEEVAAAARGDAGAAAPLAQHVRAALLHAHEYATLVALADLILPKDDRSGSASDAGAPEFIDFIVAEQPERQTAMRGGLGWLDTECRRRFDKSFRACARRPNARQVLDDIAWPARRRAEMTPRRPLLHDVARSGRRRILLEQGRRRRPRLHGQPAGSLERTAPRSSRQAGSQLDQELTRGSRRDTEDTDFGRVDLRKVRTVSCLKLDPKRELHHSRIAGE